MSLIFILLIFFLFKQDLSSNCQSVILSPSGVQRCQILAPESRLSFRIFFSSSFHFLSNPYHRRMPSPGEIQLLVQYIVSLAQFCFLCLKCHQVWQYLRGYAYLRWTSLLYLQREARNESCPPIHVSNWLEPQFPLGSRRNQAKTTCWGAKISMVIGASVFILKFASNVVLGKHNHDHRVRKLLLLRSLLTRTVWRSRNSLFNTRWLLIFPWNKLRNQTI